MPAAAAAAAAAVSPSSSIERFLSFCDPTPAAAAAAAAKERRQRWEQLACLLSHWSPSLPFPGDIRLSLSQPGSHWTETGGDNAKGEGSFFSFFRSIMVISASEFGSSDPFCGYMPKILAAL